MITFGRTVRCEFVVLGVKFVPNPVHEKNLCLSHYMFTNVGTIRDNFGRRIECKYPFSHQINGMTLFWYFDFIFLCVNINKNITCVSWCNHDQGCWLRQDPIENDNLTLTMRTSSSYEIKVKSMDKTDLTQCENNPSG